MNSAEANCSNRPFADSGGYELDPQSKLDYDIEYIETRSALLDIKYIFKTAKIVFTHNGAR